MRLGAALLVLACFPAAVPAWGKSDAQPPSRYGLPLTLTIRNPANAEATVFRVKGANQLEHQGVLHPKSSMQVTTEPRARWVVYFNCRRDAFSFTVPKRNSAQWNLPRKPCKRR